MPATPHSARTFLLLAPAYDYDEQTVIHGVYGSLRAAKLALKRFRTLPYPGGVYAGVEHRVSEVQLWVGDEVKGRWLFEPTDSITGKTVNRWTTLLDPPRRDAR